MVHKLNSVFLTPPPGPSMAEQLSGSTPQTSAVIVLNWKLPKISTTVLEQASICVCADGGANRLYDEIPKLLPNEDAAAVRKRFMPHVIAGDLDSVRDDVREYYGSLGVPVVDLSHDQDSTDLMKSIDFLTNSGAWKEHDALSRVKESLGGGAHPEYNVIVALGAHGGRLDHILGNLSILHMYRDIPLVLCGDGNVTRLVRRGQTEITPSPMEGPMCGLVPLGGQATASSTGLKWNLKDTKMQIGGLVSTCNRIQDATVWIESDADLVWTTELTE
ncbi:Thiamine pyrophosphokinase 1 [Picochlorum sp. SENEW3]|nr:Thiamine pyrophosphokinase 1 [Picochlorum sp. SENEW3]